MCELTAASGNPSKGLASAATIFLPESRGERATAKIHCILIGIELMASADVARAASIQIVALGASNTNGQGVAPEEAWPAVLERMLRAKGYEASVRVNAVNGDTSSGILNRVDSAIVSGTQVVIFDLGTHNDLIQGLLPAQTEDNAAQIVIRIRAHGAIPIQAIYDGLERQPDGVHLTAASHVQVAAGLIPKVIAAVSLHRYSPKPESGRIAKLSTAVQRSTNGPERTCRPRARMSAY